MHYEGILISWKRNKETVVARSSMKEEFRAMAYTTCEHLWLKYFLQELKICEIGPLELVYDKLITNQSCIFLQIQSSLKGLNT